MARHIAALLVLSGCGGLSILNPDWQDSDSFDTDPLDTDIDDGTGDPDTDDIDDPDTNDNPGISPPQLQSISGGVSGNDVVVTFRASDGDGNDNLVGGSIELTVGGGTTSYDIPSDVSNWSTAAGTGEVRFTNPGGSSSSGCTGGSGSSQITIVGRVVDDDGLRSQTRNTTVSVGSSGAGTITAPENGDQIYPAGSVSRPCSFQGDIATVGDGSEYGDMDAISFIPTTGASTVSLSWTAAGSDYDFLLFDRETYDGIALFGINDFTCILGFCVLGDTSGTGFENEVANLQAGQEYVVIIGGWTGSPGAYTLSLL